MPSILAIDPSLTGLACCHLDDDWATTPVFSSKPAKVLWDRIRRYEGLIRSVTGFAVDFPAEWIFLEGYSFGSRGAATVTLGEFGGLLRWRLSAWRVVEVAPATLKQFATGKGNANKTQVVAAVTKRYGVTFDSDNEYDAYALARLGQMALGMAEPTNDGQRKAMKTVAPLVAAERERAITQELPDA